MATATEIVNEAMFRVAQRHREEYLEMVNEINKEIVKYGCILK